MSNALMGKILRVNLTKGDKKILVHPKDLGLRVLLEILPYTKFVKYLNDGYSVWMVDKDARKLYRL